MRVVLGVNLRKEMRIDGNNSVARERIFYLDPAH